MFPNHSPSGRPEHRGGFGGRRQFPRLPTPVPGFLPCYNCGMRRVAQTTVSFIGPFILAPLLGFGVANAQKEPPPSVPEALHSHPGEEVVLLAHGSGSQIYTCRAGADGKFVWALKAPEAELMDAKDKVIGSHSGGPSWQLKDGSAVTGKASAQVSPDPDSIPWLLVNVVGHSGNGLLTNVTTIQRVHTRGGKPPAAGCDESHHDAETKSRYTADYYFYAPAK